MAKVMTERRRSPAEIQQIRDVKPKPKVKPHKELLKLEKGPLGAVVAAMFWKLRNQFPEFAITITPADVAEFNASLKYQEQDPEIIVDANDRFLTVRVQDLHTGDMIRVSESSEASLQVAERAKKTRRFREQTPMLVSAVRGEMSQGLISNDTINTLCDAALAMASEP